MWNEFTSYERFCFFSSSTSLAGDVLPTLYPLTCRLPWERLWMEREERRYGWLYSDRRSKFLRIQAENNANATVIEKQTNVWLVWKFVCASVPLRLYLRCCESLLLIKSRSFGCGDLKGKTSRGGSVNERGRSTAFQKQNKTKQKKMRQRFFLSLSLSHSPVALSHDKNLSSARQDMKILRR